MVPYMINLIFVIVIIYWWLRLSCCQSIIRYNFPEPPHTPHNKKIYTELILRVIFPFFILWKKRILNNLRLFSLVVVASTTLEPERPRFNSQSQQIILSIFYWFQGVPNVGVITLSITVATLLFAVFWWPQLSRWQKQANQTGGWRHFIHFNTQYYTHFILQIFISASMCALCLERWDNSRLFPFHPNDIEFYLIVHQEVIK
mgnify:CR=1 FL=1